MYYTFILQSQKDKSLYTGFTEDLKNRIKQHNLENVNSIKFKGSYKLIFYEAFLNKEDTLNKEKYLKGSYGKRSLKKMLAEYLNL